MNSGGERHEREWLRPLGLLCVVLAFTVVRPAVLIALPLALLAPLVGGTPLRAMALCVAALWFSWGGGPDGGVWFLERGWAVLLGGWFVALTLRSPRTPFLGRGLAAVAGAAISVGFFSIVSPGGWEGARRALELRIHEAGRAAQVLLEMMTPEGVPPSTVAAVEGMVKAQAFLFPALLLLQSLAALGIAWWVAARGIPEWRPALASVTKFRFPDPLVWVLIAGLLCLLLGEREGVTRLGANLSLFMAGLYVLRGVGVGLGVRGGSLSPMGWIFLVIGLIFAAPAIAAAAFVIGLGDTWLDLRARAAKAGS